MSGGQLDRRELLAALASLGLAHVTILSVGARSASAQTGGGTTPPPVAGSGGGPPSLLGNGPTYGPKPLVPNGPGTPPGGGRHHPGDLGGFCGNPTDTGLLNLDTVCGKIKEPTTGVVNHDDACSMVIQTGAPQLAQDFDCSLPVGNGAVHTDQACGKLYSPMGPTFWEDLSCGLLPGRDVDCEKAHWLGTNVDNKA